MNASSEPQPTQVDEPQRRRFEEAWMVGAPVDLADCL